MGKLIDYRLATSGGMADSNGFPDGWSFSNPKLPGGAGGADPPNGAPVFAFVDEGYDVDEE